MLYVIIFAVLGIVMVVGVLMRNRRDSGVGEPAPPHAPGTGNASRTPTGSAERKERSRRRAQAKRDRRKRH